MDGFVHDLETIIVLVVHVGPDGQNFVNHFDHEISVSRNAEDVLAEDLLALVDCSVNDKVGEIGVLGNGMDDHESCTGNWVISVDRF